MWGMFPNLRDIFCLWAYMFDVLAYSTKIEHGMINVSNGSSIVSKGTKRNGLYILDGSANISYASITSQTTHDRPSYDIWD